MVEKAVSSATKIQGIGENGEMFEAAAQLSIQTAQEMFDTIIRLSAGVNMCLCMAMLSVGSLYDYLFHTIQYSCNGQDSISQTY